MRYSFVMYVLVSEVWDLKDGYMNGRLKALQRVLKFLEDVKRCHGYPINVITVQQLGVQLPERVGRFQSALLREWEARDISPSVRTYLSVPLMSFKPFGGLSSNLGTSCVCRRLNGRIL
jgi:hypothetical protein